MSKYTLGPDVPTNEKVYDSHGNLIDQDYIDQAVDDVHQAVSGRPSLSGRGRGSSPQVAFRLPADERDRAQRLADEAGMTLSELARQALEEHIKRAS